MEHDSLTFILKNINLISRVAILENGLQTEKMLCSFAKIIKYRYEKQDTVVLVKWEMESGRMLCEFYATSMQQEIQVLDEISVDLNYILVPHYSLTAFFSAMFETMRQEAQNHPILLKLSAKEREACFELQIRYEGNHDFAYFYQQAFEWKEEPYSSLKYAMQQLNAYFGKDVVQITMKKNSFLDFLVIIPKEERQFG